MQDADKAPAAGADTRQQARAAMDLLRSGRVDEATRQSERLLAEHADDPAVLALAIEVRLAVDQPEAALELIDRAIERSLQPLALLPRKAHVLMALMRRPEAKAVASRIVELAGGADAQALWAAGRIHARCNDPGNAAICFDQALAAGCRDPELLYDLAAAQFFLGRFDEAEGHLDALLAQVPKAGDALYLRSTLRRQTPARNHVAELEATLKSGFGNPLDAAGCLYALAKEYEDLEDSGRAFSALKQGAALKRPTLRYDAAAERAAIEGIRRVYTADVIQAGEPGHPEPGAVFIVGLPRTGTTLAERLLARHPDAVSAGELPYFGGVLATAANRRMQQAGAANMLEASLQVDFAALGREYMQGARRAAGPEGRVVVDKMPINFMYCGLIRKALPNARIVHLVRDPMDACYAIHKTLFQQAYHYSCDLEELAAYYATYHRLMRHWHEVMPGDILDLRYEELVTDTEHQARRLLEWCGLDWDARVLSGEDGHLPSTTASAAQVREPVHAGSIGKWRRYERELEPLRLRLSQAGIAVG